MHRFNDGWAYKLDYDKEIANDLVEIATAERHVALAAVLTDEERSRAPDVSVVSFLRTNVDQRAPLLGMSVTEAVELFWFWECSVPRGIDVEETPGWYGRGEAADKRLDKELGGGYVLVNPQALLKKLKGRLARHRRNKAKYG